MSSVITEIPWQPTQISGCSLWLDAADRSKMSISGSSVTNWTSKGTNAITLTNANNYPTYVSNAYNNNGTIRFTFAINQALSNSSVANSVTQTNAAHTIFVVHNPNTNNSTPFAYVTAAGANRISVVTPETTFISYDSAGGRLSYTYASQATYLNGNLKLETFYVSGGSRFYRRDGSQFATNTGGSVTYDANQILYIGGAQPSYNGYAYGGDYCEIVWFNIDLTLNQIQQIEGYLAWKWGLQTNLPTTHPYKTFAPLRNGIPLSIVPGAPYLVRDRAPFLPTQITGCVTWLDPTDSTTVIRAGPTSVTQWNDKSGNGWNLTTQNGNPTYSTSLINGRAGMDLTNSAAFLSISNRTISANATVAMILVVKSGIAPWGSFFTHGNRDSDIALERNSINIGTSLLHFESANDNTTGDIAYTVDQVALYIGTISGGTSRFFARYGGGSSTTTSATNSSTISSGAQTIRIGRSDAGEACNSLIGETVYYNKVLLVSERQALEGYLAWKWGLQTSLPVGHPYAATAIVPFSYPPGGLVATEIQWSPLTISGIRFWLDASDRTTFTLSGNAVTQWRDKSSNALNFNTTTGTPTYSRNAVSMPDISVITSASSISLTTNHYVFIVARLDSNSGLRMLLALPSINQYGDYSIRYANGNLVNTQTQGGDTNDFAANYFVNGTFFPNFTYSTYSNIHIIAGQAQKSGTSTVTLSGIYTFQNRYFIGNVYEVIMYTSPPSAIQRQRMEGYLAWKWGLQVNLPASHPFARFPPST